MRTAVDRDPLVVDLDLLARLEIVIDDHLAAAADQRSPDLHRRQPIDVDMGDQIALEEDVEIGDVFGLAHHMAHAGCRNRDRALRQDEVHDGNVVHREIPHDADVMLEEPEIHADGIVVVDFSEAARDQFMHLADSARVQERMIDSQHEAAARGLIDEAHGLFGGGRDRFLDEDMLAGHQRAHGQPEMRGNRRCDGNGVNVRIPQDLLEVRRDLD